MSRKRAGSVPSGKPNGSMVATRRKLKGFIWSAQGRAWFQRAKGRHSGADAYPPLPSTVQWLQQPGEPVRKVFAGAVVAGVAGGLGGEMDDAAYRVCDE